MLISFTISWVLAKATSNVSASPVLLGVSPTILWLVVGAGLCLLELILPTAFTAFTMGLSALIVALLSPIARSPLLQVLLWMGLSAALIFFSRRLLPKRKVTSIQDATQAQTIVEIPPGETGRVLYEGNSWRARCGDDKIALAANQSVYVVGRQGTTLIVMPEHLP